MSETKAPWGLLAVSLAFVVSLQCHSPRCQAAEPAGDAHRIKHGLRRYARNHILNLFANVFHQRTHPLSTCGISDVVGSS